MKTKSSSAAITKGMPIAEIVTLIPEAKSVLAEYGLHCFSCAGSEYENLEEGCMSHGFSKEEISELVDDLNQMIKDMPERPEELIITADAARAIKKVAAEEGQKGDGLAVIADAAGGFCMEFRSESDAGDATFINAEEPSVRVFASPLTLKRIGGATIDFRDGRFKLDLQEDGPSSCACQKNSCACKH
jgi:hybrid cluster-associated redox disulfide protein